MSITPLAPQDIDAQLSTLNGWLFENNRISKTFQGFKSYLDGLAFACAVGTIAEGQNHHPDIIIGWKKVSVSFTTHDAGSQVTQKDIDAAAAIEALGYPKN